jgi:hypothetical protein
MISLVVLVVNALTPSQYLGRGMVTWSKGRHLNYGDWPHDHGAPCAFAQDHRIGGHDRVLEGVPDNQSGLYIQ